jgi:hypothetical protein
MSDQPAIPPEEMARHLSNIWFMKAYYGHAKVFIECNPVDQTDVTASGIPIHELDIKVGADWKVRNATFELLRLLIEKDYVDDRQSTEIFELLADRLPQYIRTVR